MGSPEVGGRGAAVVVSVLLVAAACMAAPEHGVIAGTAMPCGGPMLLEPLPSLTVVIKNPAGKAIARRTLGSPYHFRFTVVTGKYVVTSTVPEDAPKTVHVQAGRTSTVQLINACL